MDACCIISWFCAIYAFAEYTKIVDRLNYDVFSFIIEDNPKHRINSTFFNANYYAMMIEFIVLICIYKMMQVKTKRRIIFYISTILVNLFILYLTGCRTAWIPFVVTIPFLFLMNKRFLYFSMTMSAYAGAAGILLLKPGIFQRTTLFTDFGKRFKIWNCAFKGIKASGLAGSIIDKIKAVMQLFSARTQAKKIIKEFKPDIVIGVGGYVTAPVIYAASKLGIKTLIHEQNSIPGLSNKFIGKFADKICVSLPNSLNLFPKNKVVYTGNPRSEEIINVKAKSKKERVISSAKLKVRNNKLAAKQEIINEVFEKSIDKLTTLSKEEFLSFLENTISYYVNVVFII